jgi:hypothetical protein
VIAGLLAAAAYAQIITCQLEPLVDGVVYALPVSAGCTALDVRVAGYTLVADLVRDDVAAEQLVLVADPPDDDALAIAHDVLRSIETGAVDGHAWSVVPLP